MDWRELTLVWADLVTRRQGKYRLTIHPGLREPAIEAVDNLFEWGMLDKGGCVTITCDEAIGEGRWAWDVEGEEMDRILDNDTQHLKDVEESERQGIRERINNKVGELLEKADDNLVEYVSDDLFDSLFRQHGLPARRRTHYELPRPLPLIPQDPDITKAELMRLTRQAPAYGREVERLLEEVGRW